MRFFVFLKVMFVLTIVSLMYINMQMKIIDLAYQGTKKENYMDSLVEKNGNLTYAISTLKSSSHIGLKMLSGGLADMQFVNPDNVLHILMPIEMREETLKQSKKLQMVSDNVKSIFNILSFGKEAQAMEVSTSHR